MIMQSARFVRFGFGLVNEMIKAKTLEELENLLETGRKKALKVKPQIEIVETGIYNVRGSKNNWYEVRCGRTASGELFVACLCPGALHKGGCYHAATAFYKHVELKKLEKRLQDKPENAPYFSGGNSSNKKPEKTGNYRI